MSKLIWIFLLNIIATPLRTAAQNCIQISTHEKKNVYDFYQKLSELIEDPDRIVDAADNVSMLFVHMIQTAIQFIQSDGKPSDSHEVIRHYIDTLNPDAKKEFIYITIAYSL